MVEAVGVNLDEFECEDYYGQSTSGYKFVAIDGHEPWVVDGDAEDLIPRIKHRYGDVPVRIYK